MNDSSQLPKDGGMIYSETNLSDYFPEPLNALSSAVFLVIAIYWTIKLKGMYKYYPFLSYVLILLFIGGIGGTAYHALRRWPIFIIMDWLPIMLICLSTGIYFLLKLFSRFYVFLFTAFYFILFFFLRWFFKEGDVQTMVNLNYALMATIVLLPVIGYLIKTDWYNGKWVGFAFFSFLFALLFRVTDQWELLNFGTHFLWHSFGAMACYCMLNYLYLTNGKIVKSHQND